MLPFRLPSNRHTNCAKAVVVGPIKPKFPVPHLFWPLLRFLQLPATKPKSTKAWASLPRLEKIKIWSSSMELYPPF